MPKEGYYSLTIKKEAAEKLQALAKQRGLGVVEFFDELVTDLEQLEKIKSIETKTLVRNLADAYYLLKTVVDLNAFLKNPYTTLERLFGEVNIERISYFLLPIEDATKINALAPFALSEASKLESILNNFDPHWKESVKRTFFTRPLTRRKRLELKLDFAYRLEGLFGPEGFAFLEVIKRLSEYKDLIPALQVTIDTLNMCYNVFKDLIKKYKPNLNPANENKS